MAVRLQKNGRRHLANQDASRGVEIKTQTEVTADVVQLALRQRFNPLRNLTPQLLSNYLDQFNLGWVAYAAYTWDAIERRDDVLKGVAAKRKKDAARLDWQIITDPDADESEAKLHQEALDEFYNNLSTVNALDENERGGIALLLRQMMDAMGKYYAVHEIVWQPGEVLTAQFRFVPLWFFENRTGRLQFMTTPLGGAQGEPLEDGGWMITKGDGLMEACSVAYMFKNLPLKDWLAYSDKFGTPGILGETNASKGSDAGNAMRDAVRNFGQNWSGVIYGSDGAIKEPLKLIETSKTSESGLPFPPLIERMDRAMSALWRGADLSTMSGSKQQNVGASVQGEESDILLYDDAAMITDTLNYYVDRFVIWQKFGTTRPLAYFKLVAPEDDDTALDLKIDELLLNAGARMGEKERLEYYGRPQFDPGDTPLHEVSKVTERITPTPGPTTTAITETLPNADLEKYLGLHKDKFLKSFANDLSPLRNAIEDTLFDYDELEQRAHLRTLHGQLHYVWKQIDKRGTSAPVLTEIIANALTEKTTS